MTKTMKINNKLSDPSNFNDTIELSQSNTLQGTKIITSNISISESKKVTLDFQEIYNKLHNKFPNIINMQNPVILAIGIHKELAKEVKLSNQSIGKWVSWYIRKSKYYINHKEGAARFNLNGEPCGTISEKEINLADARKNSVNIKNKGY